MMRTLFIFTVSWSLSATQVALPPFCNNSMKLFTAEQASDIREQDAQLRQFLITQAIGEQGLSTIQSTIGRPPFSRVESKAEALAILRSTESDPSVYKPILKILDDLAPSNAWALYLNSGFHAISTHTDGHREMVELAIDQFPDRGAFGGPARVADIGIGSGVLPAAAAIKSPQNIVYGMDIAGPGHNVSTVRLNMISDLNVAKYEDPGHANTGRFWVGRGSASNRDLFEGKRFDGSSMVLAHFAIPKAERRTALDIQFQALHPGSRFVLIDPLAKANDQKEGQNFLRTIVENAYRNNPDLMAIDVAILVAKNAHQLLNIEFKTAEEQRKAGEDAGFVTVKDNIPAFFGYANGTIFEKPDR